MPRAYPPRRAWIGVRMDEADVRAVEEHAKREGVDRSEMLRRLIRRALDHQRTGDEQ